MESFIAITILVISVIIFICIIKRINNITREVKANSKEREKQKEKDKYYDKLTELQKLKDKNIITQEEFEREKEKIKYVKI